MAASATKRSKAQKLRTRPCTSIPIKPSASPSVWGRSSAIWPRAAAAATATDPVMESSASSVGQLVETLKRFARRLLIIGENRFELLMVEVQEERERLLRAILLALGVAGIQRIHPG